MPYVEIISSHYKEVYAQVDELAITFLSNETDNVKGSVKLSDIEDVQILKVNNPSDFCSTMDYGMTNPTFLLPTNVIIRIIQFFQKKKKLVVFQISLKDKRTIIAKGEEKLFITLKSGIRA